jgi:hypothetical protein
VIDIRATHYVSPLSEVEFESIPLTVHIVNAADETGLVTGKFRVYNDTTGLLIHTSDIAPFSLTAGAAVDASALTDFDPPSPADDVYFVIFDGNASNPLVPDGIGIHLGAFYFDVKPVGMGPAPAVHAPSHEAGGGDEIDVTDLGGLLADAQTPLTHAATHQNGGTDELSIAGLSGTLADAQTPAAHDHAGDNLKFVKVHPSADSTSALQILKADDATVVLRVDTTNARVGIGTGAPAHSLDVSAGNIRTGVDAGSGYLYFGGSTHYIRCDYGNWYFSGATAADDLALILNPGGGGTIQCLQGNLHINSSVAASYLTLETQSTVRVYIDDTGKVGIGTTAPAISDGIGLHITGKILRLATAKTPATAGAAGNAGEICWDADYIYVCVATNTWVRVETQTW